MSDVSQIDGSAIRLKREAQGWALTDMANRACLSVKQIRQIEEGGMTAFYSESVKLTAARKVAGLLQMSETQLFGQQPPPIDPPEEDLLQASAQETKPDLSATLAAAPVAAANPLLRGEALHVLAQPPEHLDEPQSTDAAAAEDSPSSPPEANLNAPTVVEETAAPAPTSAAPPAPDTAAPSEAPTPEGSGYVMKIAALFLVALAAAALLRPKALEDKPELPAAMETPAPPPVLNPSSGSLVTEGAPAAESAPATTQGGVPPVATNPAAPSATPAAPASSSPVNPGTPSTAPASGQ